MSAETSRYYWEMIDSLRNALTIHQISYTWNIYGELEKQDIEEVVHSAQEYVDLFDHEAIHCKAPGSYCGAEGDVTKNSVRSFEN